MSALTDALDAAVWRGDADEVRRALADARKRGIPDAQLRDACATMIAQSPVRWVGLWWGETDPEAAERLRRLGTPAPGTTKNALAGLATLLACVDAEDLRREGNGAQRTFGRAVEVGWAGLVKLLLPMSDPGALDSSGRTILIRAARDASPRHAEVIALLLPFCDPAHSLVSDGSDCALSLAVFRGSKECVALLAPGSTPRQRLMAGAALMGDDSHRSPGADDKGCIEAIAACSTETDLFAAEQALATNRECGALARWLDLLLRREWQSLAGETGLGEASAPPPNPVATRRGRRL